MDQFEKEAYSKGFTNIAGIDEAGRGPLAGPVFASAVIMNPKKIPAGINDSKKLSPSKRDYFFNKIIESALSYSISNVSEGIIDEINIREASKFAMEKSAEKLSPQPDILLIDGNMEINYSVCQKTIKKGDSRSYSIAAASILAKVSRDRLMMEYHEIYPQYGFNRHKGYPTKEHIENIRKFGPCPIHRKTFRYVKDFIPASK